MTLTCWVPSRGFNTSDLFLSDTEWVSDALTKFFNYWRSPHFLLNFFQVVFQEPYFSSPIVGKNSADRVFRSYPVMKSSLVTWVSSQGQISSAGESLLFSHCWELWYGGETARCAYSFPLSLSLHSIFQGWPVSLHRSLSLFSLFYWLMTMLVK